MSVRYAHTDVSVPDFDDYRIKTASSETLTDLGKMKISEGLITKVLIMLSQVCEFVDTTVCKFYMKC